MTIPLDFGWLVAGALFVLCSILAAIVRFEFVNSRRIAKENLNLTGAIERSPVARLVTDQEDRAVLASGAWRRLIGFDADAPLARLEPSLFSDPDAVAKIARLRAAAADGEEAFEDFRMSGERGEWRRFSVTPVSVPKGAVLWAAEDVTSEHKMDDAVQAEHENLSRMLSDEGIGVFSVDQTGSFRFVDQTVAGWLGKPAETLCNGDTLSDYLIGAVGDGDRFDALALGPGPTELALSCGDGRTRHFSLTQTVLRDRFGTLYTRSLLHDPERQSAVADNTVANALLDFVSIAPIPVAVLHGQSGEILSSNAPFSTLIGRSGATVSGDAIASLVEASFGEAIGAWLNACVKTGGPRTVDITMQDGTPASLTGASLTDGDGAVRVVAYVVARPETLEVDPAMIQTQKMELVGQLAGGVAHDFNNLLTAMIGFCDLLLTRHSPKDQSFGDIVQIKQNANRAANLVRQLLAFSRQQTLQPKTLNLTDVLAELTHLLQRLIGASVDLKIVHGRDLGMIRVDQGQLEQVVINLAVNARDAMPDGGTLTIRTYDVPADHPTLRDHREMQDGAYVALEVSDTGEGIAPENLEKIYEPFFTTKEVGAGTGLGLATVYGIIKQTGGFIYVDSDIGKGAKFTIYLPRHDPNAAKNAPERDAADVEIPEAAKPDLTGAGTVLLVEDEDAVRLFGARALRQKGYQVLEARNGEDALETLNAEDAERIDLLITDVVMPEMDGPTLIRHVRESHPDLKIIFISGYAEDTFRQKVDQEETIHFLPKPFSLEELAGKVKEVMPLEESDV